MSFYFAAGRRKRMTLAPFNRLGEWDFDFVDNIGSRLRALAAAAAVSGPKLCQLRRGSRHR